MNTTKKLVYLLIISVLLKLVLASCFGLHNDETFTQDFTNSTYAVMYDKVIHIDVVSPTYYIIQKGWNFGIDSLLWQRCFNILISCISIGVVYEISKVLYSKNTFLPVVLFTFFPINIYYSVQLRQYSLLILFGVLSLYALLKVIIDGTTESYILFGVINGVGVWFHYYFCFYIFAQFIYVFIHKRQFKKLLISGVAVLLLVLPLSFIYFQQRQFAAPTMFSADFVFLKFISFIPTTVVNALLGLDYNITHDATIYGIVSSAILFGILIVFTIKLYRKGFFVLEKAPIYIFSITAFVYGLVWSFGITPQGTVPRNILFSTCTVPLFYSLYMKGFKKYFILFIYVLGNIILVNYLITKTFIGVIPL